MIDTHAHIYDKRFDEDLDLTITRAREAGVERIILPAVDSSSHGALDLLLDRYKGVCFGAMGLHPTSINENPNYRDELRIVEQRLESGRYVAVGEIGLDLYWSKEYLGEQIESLKFQLELALRFELPVILHVRDAWSETLEVLERFAGRGLRGVFHSFSGTIEDYRRIEQLGGFMVGLGGPLTYKNSPLREVVSQIDITKIVVETDAPYLPPVPHRGQRNEPAYVARVVEMIALIKGCSRENVDKITSDNANSIFFA